MVEIKSSSVKFSRTELEEFEERIGCKVVDAFVDFLKVNNGGKPALNRVIIENAEENDIQEFSINYFFGLAIERDNNLLEQYGVFGGSLPQNTIPIARTEGGDILCIKLNTNNFGAVQLFDHDTEKLINVSPTFDKLMEMLQPFEDPDLEGYTVTKVWVDPDFLKSLKDK
jgi:hypothetical protein